MTPLPYEERLRLVREAVENMLRASGLPMGSFIELYRWDALMADIDDIVLRSHWTELPIPMTVAKMKKLVVLRAMEAAEGRPAQAAALAGMNRVTFNRILKGIKANGAPMVAALCLFLLSACGFRSTSERVDRLESWSRFHESQDGIRIDGLQQQLEELGRRHDTRDQGLQQTIDESREDYCTTGFGELAWSETARRCRDARTGRFAPTFCCAIRGLVGQAK